MIKWLQRHLNPEPIILLTNAQPLWRKGLLYKLKQNGISGKLFDLTEYLNFIRKQRVVLNGQYSSWTRIEVRVPQELILFDFAR